MKLPITAVILTYNEELNLERCLKSVRDLAAEIFVVDSFSTDETFAIALRYGAEIHQHEFKNQAVQFNWALDNLDIKSEWILRLDADEYLTEELKEEIEGTFQNIKMSDVLNIDGDNFGTSDIQKLAINGFYIKRRVYFMGRWIKHGGYYPTWFLRLFRKNKAKYEEREVDEHMVLLEGETLKLCNDFIDDNKQELKWWINKQNNHSSREVMAMINENKNLSVKPDILSDQVGRKRWLKEKFYLKLPMFFRTLFYFIYRYFFRLGFLDGKEGLIFHFLNALWYRFLVDAKLYEYQKKR